MLLNCDLGESYGCWSMGHEASVMPFIDQASIACGFHAGDPLTIQRTLALAAQHQVAIGAHPDEIIANLHYQVAALQGMARTAGLTLSYVKPHGALYHDMMHTPEVRTALLQAMASYASGDEPLALVMQATAQAEEHRAQAQAAGVPLLLEAFADRCYGDDGSLLPRNQAGAVHNRQRILAQVAQLRESSSVTTHSGRILALQYDTLCVHGDNPEGVAAIADIRALATAG